MAPAPTLEGTDLEQTVALQVADDADVPLDSLHVLGNQGDQSRHPTHHITRFGTHGHGMERRKLLDDVQALYTRQSARGRGHQEDICGALPQPWLVAHGRQERLGRQQRIDGLVELADPSADAAQHGVDSRGEAGADFDEEPISHYYWLDREAMAVRA